MKLYCVPADAEQVAAYASTTELHLLPREHWPDQPGQSAQNWWLQYQDGRLRLARGADGKGVCVEPADIRRRAVRSSELAKACGLSARPPSAGAAPTILDGTSGWGVDALTLARLGANVTLIEQCTPVWALAHDLLRTQAEPQTSLHHAELWQWLAHASAAPFDVIYLDPMFPPRNKTAAPSKRLQYLAALLGEESPQQTVTPVLEEWVLRSKPYARHRIVLKRRRSDPQLSVAPTWQIKGRSVRYDVYSSARI